MLYTRFNSPIPADILFIPIHLILSPSLIVFVINPKICSTRARILLFFRLLLFCVDSQNLSPLNARFIQNHSPLWRGIIQNDSPR